MTFLISDLCMDKAYIAIEEIKNIYTYDLCQEIFFNEDYDLNLRQGFCNLLKNLWINVAPFKKMTIPEYVQIWDDLDTEPSICHSMEDTTKFRNLKEYISKYLNNAFCKLIEEDDEEYKENNNKLS